MSPRVELVGAVEVDGADAGLDPARSHRSWDELRAQGDLDFAVVALPTALHEEASVAIAGDGVHLLVEKPLALSQHEAADSGGYRAIVEPRDVFWSPHYLRHNQRRQEHLASLGLNLASQTVLEVGAGIGDHTSFFLDRGCTIVVTDAQKQNLAVLRERYPELTVRQLDLDQPSDDVEPASIVYCYGTLYHLEHPASAIAWMAARTESLLLLETCVAYGDTEVLYDYEEQPGEPDNAIRGRGCRPTRPWVRRELARHFPFVYFPTTQPWHSEFPLDWTDPALADEPLIRAVFVASRDALDNPVLTTSVPMQQTRH